MGVGGDGTKQCGKLYLLGISYMANNFESFGLCHSYYYVNSLEMMFHLK